jgi:hypothetical protein
MALVSGKVVEAIVFKLEIMYYELGRTKTAVVSAVLSGGNSNLFHSALRQRTLQLGAISNDGSHIETFRQPQAGYRHATTTRLR